MKKWFCLILTILTFIPIVYAGGPHSPSTSSERKPAVYVGPVKPVLYSKDHVSEGVLAPLDSGRILLIFRRDPGREGDHVGTSSHIAQIPFDPKNDQWGEVSTIYDSVRYDDRNVHGGVTKNGRIVVFFRKYDGRDTVKRHFMYSDDGGETWTDPRVSDAWSDPGESSLAGIWSTGQMFYIPEKNRYAMLGCRRYITYSRDGRSWEEYNKITENTKYDLTEVAGAWCGDGRIVALIRDNQHERGHPLLQLVSEDAGDTWSKPAQTNIPPNRHWGAAPQLIYNRSKNLLIALTSDRYTRPPDRNSLFVYTARPDEIIGNPENWTMQHEIKRPWARAGFTGDRPLNHPFYGYPTIASIGDGEYLVVFTERARMKGTEQADLYYFRMRVED